MSDKPPTTPNSGGLQIRFKKLRETKNTVRFEEENKGGGLPPVIGTLYLQKWCVKDATEVTVTLEWEAK
jgi:hypothetical protein